MSKKKTSSYKPVILPRRLLADLSEADRLLEDKKPDQARQMLEALDRQRPNQPGILRLLVNACYDAKDMRGYEWAIYRLNRLERNDPDIALGLAGAYLTRVRPGLAIRAFEHFLKRWPGQPRSAEASQTVAELRRALLKEMGELDQPEEEAIEMAAQHDEVRFFLEYGQYQQGKQVAEKLLRRYPNFVSVLNNLVQIHTLEGNWREGMELSHRVLEIEPENVHALSNLTRLLFLSGDFEAAKVMAQRLSASQAPAIERWTKKAEALSQIGDDEAVLALYKQVGQAGELKSLDAGHLFLHFVAVALANNGQVEKARLLWREAMKLEPSFNLPRRNLEDLDLSPGERNGPWAFDFSSWLSLKLIREMTAILSGPVKRKSERAVETAARRFLQQHSELTAMFPHILARGDAEALEFVVRLGRLAETPDLLAALKDFALGQRGSDKLRLETARFLSEKGLLPSGANRLWMNGEWGDLLLLSFEVTPEPVSEFSTPEARELGAKAIGALNDGDGKQAQEILERALALEPDSPSLLNNLAMAYQMQKQYKKAISMVREIHTRFPDYFFGIVAMAHLAIDENDFETARALLAEVMQRKRLHVTEFDALCIAQIELYLAEKNKEAAQSWFKMWEQPDPEDPKLEYYRARLFGQQSMKRFLGNWR